MKNIKKTENAQTNTKVREYTILRVIATLLVVIGHSMYLYVASYHGSINYQFPIESNTIISTIFKLTMKIAVYHMPLFFILSGAVYRLSEKNSLKELTKKKAKRLVLPYFIYGLLFVLPVKIIGDFYTNANLLEVLKEFFLGGEGGHLWFLLTLFWTTIAFYLISKPFKNKSILAPLVISLALQLVSTKLILPAATNILLLRTGISYIFWYALGYAVESFRQKHKMPKFYPIIEMIVLFTIVLINRKYHFLHSYLHIIAKAFIWLDVARILANTKLGNWKFIDFLEKNSMYIYLFHDPLEYVILKYSFQFNLLDSTAGTILYVFLRIIGVIIISILLGMGVEKIKKIFKNRKKLLGQEENTKQMKKEIELEKEKETVV